MTASTAAPARRFDLPGSHFAPLRLDMGEQIYTAGLHQDPTDPESEPSVALHAWSGGMCMLLELTPLQARQLAARMLEQADNVEGLL